MKIMKILKSDKNKFTNEEQVKKLLAKGISSKILMNILAEHGLNIACIIQDKNDRRIIISSFGVAQLNTKNIYADRLDSCDGGLVSCGLYEKNPSLLTEENYGKFDFVVLYYTDLITCGKNMTGYRILASTNVDMDMAISDGDSEAFQIEIDRYDSSKITYIPEIKFIEE